MKEIRVKLTLIFSCPAEGVDGYSDLDHAVMNYITHVGNTCYNMDDWFDKLGGELEVLE